MTRKYFVLSNIFFSLLSAIWFVKGAFLLNWIELIYCVIFSAMIGFFCSFIFACCMYFLKKHLIEQKGKE